MSVHRTPAEARDAVKELTGLNKKTAHLQLVPEGTDRDHMRLDADLRALDEALRFSARAARWPDGDTGNEGIPPDEIQKHQSGIFEGFTFDELPEGLRFLGWATYRETETEIVVTAVRRGADPLFLGSWPHSVWLEYVRRFYGAEGE